MPEGYFEEISNSIWGLAGLGGERRVNDNLKLLGLSDVKKKWCHLWQTQRSLKGAQLKGKTIKESKDKRTEGQKTESPGSLW